MVEGYFSGMSKWVSKWFIELCGDLKQFWDGGYGRGCEYFGRTDFVVKV